MWIGDFVRCHTVVRLLNRRFPGRPVDLLTTTLTAPLLEFMPGVRKGIEWNLPRKRLALGEHQALAARLRAEKYGHALVMPRTWKSALAPYLADIPLRTGFLGEMRLGLLNDIRLGEKRLPRMADRCAALALERGEARPNDWPEPALAAPESAVAAWRQRNGLAGDDRAVVAFAPGAVGPSKRWPAAYYADLAKRLAAEGMRVWVLGGPDEKQLAAGIVQADPVNIRDLTGADLRNAILALAAADVAVSNDSGLLHVAAALRTPAIGIFGPTSPWHWAPLNPLAGIIETASELACRPCHKPDCRLVHHRCMREIPVDQVFAVTRRALAATRLHQLH
jgi:heptosyltransferase-2